jgi:transcriptional regulator
MYVPPAFVEDRLEELHEIMRAASLPVLISPVRDAGLGVRMAATHLPLMLAEDRLIGHVARANGHWREFDPAAESLAIFAGVDGYVSPSHYATKQETGRVVPTWNYQAVHAYGRLEIVEEPSPLLDIVTKLTARYEGPRAKPWAVSDAPADYIAAHLKGIVGVVLHITRLQGVRKLSQNKSAADQAGVLAGQVIENPALASAMQKVKP